MLNILYNMHAYTFINMQIGKRDDMSCEYSVIRHTDE